jgi:lambda family phage portal protein
MNYEAARQGGSRSGSWRATPDDADAAGAARARLAAISRDMVRNNHWAARAGQVIAQNAVGEGILPKAVGASPRLAKQILTSIESHLDTTAVDVRGQQNLYGLQRQVMLTVVESGEALVLRRRLPVRATGLPLQIDVLEPDYLDDSRDILNRPDGSSVREGIEYDPSGRRVAYWLYDEHPGAANVFGRRPARRVPAADVLHIFRPDRPGQTRGVSWLAPVALALSDLHDFQDAQVVRQKISACFAAFVTDPEGTLEGRRRAVESLSSIAPGRVQFLDPGQEISFGVPPGVQGYDEFTRGVLCGVAAALGLTYEALTGDLRNVNFSSGRMGRMEMDRAVKCWQSLMLIPQMMQPLGKWFFEAWALQYGAPPPRGVRLDWVAPTRILVDPTREIPAMAAAVAAGLRSRPEVVRELGYDPERVDEEIQKDQDRRRAIGLRFTSDGPDAQAPAAPAPEPRGGNEEEENAGDE